MQLQQNSRNKSKLINKIHNQNQTNLSPYPSHQPKGSAASNECPSHPADIPPPICQLPLASTIPAAGSWKSRHAGKDYFVNQTTFVINGKQLINFYNNKHLEYTKMSNSNYSLDSNTQTVYKRPYHKLTQQERNNLIQQVVQNKMSISKAATKLGINNSTAKIVIRKFKKALKTKKQPKKDTNTSETSSCLNTERTYQFSQAPLYFFYMPITPPMFYQQNPMYPVPQFPLCINL